MARTTSKEKFVSSWNAHVDEFSLLMFHLDTAQVERLAKAQLELKSLIEAAGKDMSQIEKMVEQE